MEPKDAGAPGTEWPTYDAIAKDIFERDRPALLSRLTGGIAVKGSLNVEFAAVTRRRCDLLFDLADGDLFLLDFQSDNDEEMEYRIGIYSLFAAQKYRRKVRAAVLYIGSRRMNMARSLDAGCTKVDYVLIDIQEVDAADLLEGGPGDWALAILAKGGVERVREIIAKAMTLPAARRDRVLAQLIVLSGLRRVAQEVKMEVEQMGVQIDIEENEFLREIFARGEASGAARGAAAMLHDLLETKFGALPAWAGARLETASAGQIQVWSRKVLTAGTLEGVIGRQ